MIKDKIKLKMKGFLNVNSINCFGEQVESIHLNNAIIDGIEIIGNLTSGDSTYKVDSITAFNSSNVTLASTPIVNSSFNLLNKQITYEAIFSVDSFDGTVEKFQLNSSQIPLVFSEVNGFSISKNNSQQLQVIWIIQL